MTLHTANTRDAGTTSNILLQLIGKQGADSERWFEAHERRFSIDGSEVQLNLRASRKLGDLIKVKVGVDGQGSSPSWLLEKVCSRLRLHLK